MARNSVVKVTVLGDAQQFNRTMAQTETTAAKFGKAVDGAKLAVGALVGSAVVGQVVSFGKRMQEVATVAEGVESRFDTVFGEMAGSMSAWVDEQNEAFGTSENGLKNLAAGIGDLLVPLGFARDEAAGMTQDVLLLANALSEWTSGQVSVEQASDAVRKSLLGEREMLKELGVAISEADVQQALAAKGMSGLTGEALAQAKAQVTLELVTAKSADALAQYERRTGTALAEQKAFTAALEESEQSLAQAFAPEVEYVQGLLFNAANNAADMAGTLRDMRGASDESGEAVGSLGAELEVWQRAIGLASGSGAEWVEMIRELINGSDDAEPSIAELSTAMDRARHSAAGAGAAFDEEAAALDELRTKADRAEAAIKSLHDEQRAAIDPAFKLFKATQDYNEAVEERERLERDGKKGTEAWTEASLGSLDALMELEEARDGFSSDEAFAEHFRAVARAAGLTADEIDRLLRTILGLDGMAVSVGGSGSRFTVSASAPQYAFHDGGVVPGPPGTEVPALLMAGETVLPTHKAGYSSGGTEVIQVVLDGAVVAEAVRRHNTVAQRRGIV